MQNVKRLIVWAKAQDRMLKKAGDAGNNNAFSQYMWIRGELLPKLEEILHTSSNTASTPLCDGCNKPFPELICYCEQCLDSVVRMGA